MNSTASHSFHESPIPDSSGLALNYETFTLDNGLKVVVHRDSTAPVVAVHLWYHVGSKNERPDRRGFAHMFEHMMFRGTDRLGPEGHFDAIRRTGGDANAYTAFDQTVYVQELPSDQLELAFWERQHWHPFASISQRNTTADVFRGVLMLLLY